MSQELLSSWWFKDEFGFSMVPPPEAGMVFCKAMMVCAKGDGELAGVVGVSEQDVNGLIGLVEAEQSLKALRRTLVLPVAPPF